MADLQNLEQSTYNVLQDYFKLLGRRGWVSQISVNRVLVLLFAVQFWWKYSVLMNEYDILTLQRLFNCLGADCLIPSMRSDMHDKVVINKRSFDSTWTALAGEKTAQSLMAEMTNTTFLMPEED